MYYSRMQKNIEQVEKVHYKISEEYKRLSMTTNWLEKKDELGGKAGEYVTLGTNENKSLVTKSAVLPVGAVATGIVSAGIGLLILTPLLGGAAVNQQEEEFINGILNAAPKVFGFSKDAFILSLKLALVPIGVTAISIPKKVLRVIKEQINPYVVYDEEILKLIEDILEDKEDPTLEFPKLFLKRVNISNCSTRFNRKLLENFTYYRFCLQQIEKNNMTEEDAKEAFADIISFLKEAKNKPFVPSEFKNNRFVNTLVDEFGYKEEDFHKTR